MQFVEDEAFNDYVNAFKRLPLLEKNKVIETELKELLMILEQLNEKKNKKNYVIINREIIDLNKDKFYADDFSEAVFVYINTIKELIASLIGD